MDPPPCEGLTVAVKVTGWPTTIEPDDAVTDTVRGPPSPGGGRKCLTRCSRVADDRRYSCEGIAPKVALILMSPYGNDVVVHAAW
jgi:hypothetical protein